MAMFFYQSSMVEQSKRRDHSLETMRREYEIEIVILKRQQTLLRAERDRVAATSSQYRILQRRFLIMKCDSAPHGLARKKSY